MQLLASEVSADYYARPPELVCLLMLTITYILTYWFNNHIVYSLYWIVLMETSVVGTMKMGNIVPKAGIEPTYLTFWAIVLPIHHLGYLMSQLCSRLPIYVSPCLTCQCKLLHMYICIRMSICLYAYVYSCIL